MEGFILFINQFALVYLVLIVAIRIGQFLVLANSARKSTKKDDNYTIDKSKVNDITIIIPAFNEANIISDSLRSMLSLDYPDYKVMVVNDGSTDNTLEILEKEFEIVAGAYWIFSSSMTMFTLLIKSKFFNEKKYFSNKNVATLVIYCFIDAFGYRQLNSIYKLISIVLFRTRKTWTPITRKALK